MKLLYISALCALSFALTSILSSRNVPTVQATSFNRSPDLLAQLFAYSPVAGQSGSIQEFKIVKHSENTITMSRQAPRDDVSEKVVNKKIQVPNSTPIPIANPIQNNDDTIANKQTVEKPSTNKIGGTSKKSGESSDSTAAKASRVVESSDKTPLYQKYGAEYGVDPVIMQKIASCESGERADATNGPYGGMFQFVASTWSSNRKAMGEDPNPDLRFDAEEAVKTAAFKMSRDGFGAWPACSRKVLAQAS